MHAGRTTRSNSDGTTQSDPFLVANELGFTLHIRAREGSYMRGKHIWYDGRLSLPRQRAMLRECIAQHRSRLKPMRSVKSKQRHNAA